ncbi:peptidoglycan DD-metalloendopeptidase family protein [Streptomyces sp. NPDC001744]|uniref:peptidoglycan DD-metalloendopeptidase family protein n=1 Tax=Streptomyces sp. NPDC001744 TaxID=3364606 RepID=UPI0036B5EBBB
MNDQHPHAGYVGDDAHTTGSFAVDPLFGAYPDGHADHSGQWDLGPHAATGTYDTTGQYDTGQHGTGSYDTTGQWDATGQWATTGQWNVALPHDATGSYATAAAPYDTTGQWDASAWTEAQHTGQYETLHSGAYAAQGAYGYETYSTTGQWAAPAFATETGAYDATAWNHAAPESGPVVPHQYAPRTEGRAEHPAESPVEHTAEFAFPYDPETEAYADLPSDGTAETDGAEAPFGDDEADVSGEDPYDCAEAPHEGPAAELRTAPPAAGRPARRSSAGGRSRRRTPAKRSALLTVAVPSACVVGAAGIAAASVGGLTGSGAEGEQKGGTTALAAADTVPAEQVAANKALDTQLAALSEDARDFGARASRTQERIDLRVRQAADKKKREEEAARKEALRPKYALPVKLHRLSARFGQAGLNWMSVHTGIDFPVFGGTPVMAATDGTVRTQLNSAYGNMVIVTAPDGTETWYCHLSSAKIRSGHVKAGDVIAYSGDSGNSTGPHLHFEVRPNGGYAIDPLAWFRSHGLDPTAG